LQQIVFHSRYSVALMPWLYDHRFYGSIIVAGATYLAGVIAGAVEAFKAHECILKDIAFPRPMFLLDENARLVNLILEPEGSRRSSFQVVSRDEAVEERDEEGQLAWKLHASGRIEWGADEKSENGWEDVPLGSIRKWQWESLSVDEFYRTGWDCGMQAGPSFKWIDRLWRRPS